MEAVKEDGLVEKPKSHRQMVFKLEPVDFVEEMTGPEKAVEPVQQPPQCSQTKSKAKSKRKMANFDDDNGDIEVVITKRGRICPVSGKEIEIPVRNKVKTF
jgi:hypothetical protein